MSPVFIPEEFVKKLNIPEGADETEVLKHLRLSASILVLGTAVYPDFNIEAEKSDGKLADPPINSGKQF